MEQNKIKTILKLILLVILIFFPNKIISNSKEALKLNKASFAVIQKDSLLLKYKVIEKLYKKEKYYLVLEKSLVLVDECIKYGNKSLQIKSLNIIALTYSKTLNNKKAIKYYKKVIKLTGKLNIQEVESNSLSEKTDLELIKNEANLKIGGAYQRLALKTDIKKEREKYLIYKDSAKYFYNKIVSLPELNNDILRLKAKSYSNLSGIFSVDSAYKQAKQYALKALDIHRKLNDKLFEAAAMSNLASIYLYENKFREAKKIYIEALELIKYNENTIAVQFKESLYENIGYSMYMLKDYKAYDFQEKAFEIKDKLRDKDITRIIEEIETKRKIEVAKQEAREANSKVELKKLQDRNTTLFFSVLSFLVILISGVILYNYKLRQRNLKLKFSQKELIQKQNIEKIKSESQIKILNATLDGKESERKQIAETLHDSVSTMLSSATLHLQATRKQFNGSTPIEIDKTQKIITEASQKIRDLSHTLVSSVLLKFGLNFALKDMADKYSNSEITIHTDLKDLRRYQQGFEIKAHNIIQEFVNNVLKHSKAKNATVYLEEKENKLFLRIEDDGQGFNIDEAINKDGLGINQIDARIQMMKGKFEIESEPNKGTTIIVELPIVEKEPVSYA